MDIEKRPSRLAELLILGLILILITLELESRGFCEENFINYKALFKHELLLLSLQEISTRQQPRTDY